MKNAFVLYLLAVSALVSCSKQSALETTRDFEYKYEVAKQYYFEGKYSAATVLFSDVVTLMRGTAYAEEALFMTAMSHFRSGDYESASQYFRKYYESYPKGQNVELARYNCGLAMYRLIPDPRLDQTSTYAALSEFQDFLLYYPNSSIKDETQEMIYILQDRLVEKEYLAAKLYYDLGSYTMNCAFGGNNYEACVVTSQNALRDFPYATTERREALSVLILRSKFQLAQNSVEVKRVERYRDCIDEYYAFKNDFPESKFMKEAEGYFVKSSEFVRTHSKGDEVVD